MLKYLYNIITMNDAFPELTKEELEIDLIRAYLLGIKRHWIGYLHHRADIIDYQLEDDKYKIKVNLNNKIQDIGIHKETLDTFAINYR